MEKEQNIRTFPFGSVWEEQAHIVRQDTEEHNEELSVYGPPCPLKNGSSSEIVVECLVPRKKSFAQNHTFG